MYFHNFKHKTIKNDYLSPIFKNLLKRLYKNTVITATTAAATHTQTHTHDTHALAQAHTQTQAREHTHTHAINPGSSSGGGENSHSSTNNRTFITTDEMEGDPTTGGVINKDNTTHAKTGEARNREGRHDANTEDGRLTDDTASGGASPRLYGLGDLTSR